MTGRPTRGDRAGAAYLALQRLARAGPCLVGLGEARTRGARVNPKRPFLPLGNAGQNVAWATRRADD